MVRGERTAEELRGIVADAGGFWEFVAAMGGVSRCPAMLPRRSGGRTTGEP